MSKWIYALIIPSLVVWYLIGNAAFGKTITHDRGGSVMLRVNEILSNWGQEIRVEGFCASACTLYMGTPNACTTKRARWLFHAASEESATQIMAGFYPEPIRSLFLTDYQFREVTLRGSELIRVGAIGECD